MPTSQDFAAAMHGFAVNKECQLCVALRECEVTLTVRFTVWCDRLACAVAWRSSTAWLLAWYDRHEDNVCEL